MMKDNVRGIHDVLRFLLSAIANSTLYGKEHPQAFRLGSQAYAGICTALDEVAELSLMVIENELVINGLPRESSPYLDRFCRILKANGIGHINFLRGITREEMDDFIAYISSHHDAGSRIVSSEHLRLGQVVVHYESEAEDGVDNGHDAKTKSLSLQDIPGEETARLMEIYEAIKRHRKLKISGVLEIVSGFVEAFRQEGKPMLLLAALREMDEYTFTHSTNVCILNLAQAMSLGIEGQLLKDIGISAMLHDIGKFFVPEEILTKNGRLTDEEFAIIKEHPVKGARYLLKEASGVPRMAPIAAFEHHARFNLSGYPKLPHGWDLNLCSHMTMISDFFDAMRTRRSYREPLDLEEIAPMMLDMAGTELHAALTRNFLHIISGLGDVRQQSAAVPDGRI